MLKRCTLLAATTSPRSGHSPPRWDSRIPTSRNASCKVSRTKEQPIRLGFRRVVEGTNSWLANYGHRYAAPPRNRSADHRETRRPARQRELRVASYPPIPKAWEGPPLFSPNLLIANIWRQLVDTPNQPLGTNRPAFGQTNASRRHSTPQTSCGPVYRWLPGLSVPAGW